jgi:hypothetical protein
MSLFAFLNSSAIGAIGLPVAMFALFHLFALCGGDLLQLWVIYRVPARATNESLRVALTYIPIGALLGCLTGYVFIGLRKKERSEGAGFWLAVGGVTSLYLVGAWLNSATNQATIIEPLLLNGFPTVWFLILLALVFKRRVMKPEADYISNSVR